jgi:ubiquinone/menaquinone biosynthesis C-methylase UbiE
VAQFHFVEDYERLVAKLIETYPIDEAMSMAVGGAYLPMGEIEADVMQWAGLKEGMAVFDLGCGSGRLAHALSKRFARLDYLGADIVLSLLEYAATKTPQHYNFVLNRKLGIPLADSSVDYCASFSVFTHLLHSETFIYLEEMFRVLKPGGRVVMSFLEFSQPGHWKAFADECDARRTQAAFIHLNSHIERPVIDLWATKIGFEKAVFVSGDAAPWETKVLGQSLAVLRKRR